MTLTAATKRAAENNGIIMKKFFLKLTALTAAVVLAFPQMSVSAAGKSPQQIVDDMRLGWNLGNTLDSFGGGSDPDTAETYWVHIKTDRQMINDVKAKGFNTVRVPVTWYEKLDNGRINADWLKRVKEIVDLCIDNNMYVILNTHHETDNIVPTYAMADSSEAYLRNLWSQIAPYFKDYDEHLIFETMNEPRIIGDRSEWTNGTEETRTVINRLNAAAVEEIRKTGGNNSTRLIMCPGNAAHIPAAVDFKLPDDKNVILSVHNYAPYGFAMAADGTDVWGSDADKREMDKWLKELYDRYVSKGVPVVIGEMGATDKLNTSAREAWAGYYAQTAKSYGITCVVWDNNVISPDLSDTEEHYGLYNRAAHTWYYGGIADALSAGVDAAVPYTGGTADPYTTVLYSGESVGLSNLDNQVVTDDMPYLADGYFIAVKYTGSEPYLALQNYNIGEWNTVAPDKTENGTAFYSYESINRACKTGYKNQIQLLVSAHGSNTAFTEVSVTAPHKNGDVTGDGVVNKRDAKLILAVSCGFNMAFGTKYADADNNNIIDLLDVIAALRAE